MVSKRVFNLDVYFKKTVKYVGEPMTHLEYIASSAICAAIKVKTSVIIYFSSSRRAAGLMAKYKPMETVVIWMQESLCCNLDAVMPVLSVVFAVNHIQESLKWLLVLSIVVAGAFEVFLFQKLVVYKCNMAGKYVVFAAAMDNTRQDSSNGASVVERASAPTLSDAQFQQLVVVLTSSKVSTPRLHGKKSLEQWIIDTGASNYMSGNIDLFFELHDISSEPVGLPNGELARALINQRLGGCDRENLLTLDRLSSVGLFVVGYVRRILVWSLFQVFWTWKTCWFHGRAQWLYGTLIRWRMKRLVFAIMIVVWDHMDCSDKYGVEWGSVLNQGSRWVGFLNRSSSFWLFSMAGEVSRSMPIMCRGSKAPEVMCRGSMCWRCVVKSAQVAAALCGASLQVVPEVGVCCESVCAAALQRRCCCSMCWFLVFETSSCVLLSVLVSCV